MKIQRSKNVVVVIPARYASTRFPGKPLVEILGKPMIQYVYEQASCCKFIQRVIVATDDKRIYKRVEDFGGEAMMTAKHHVSGSDRVAEVAKKIDADIIVNVQGDEPLLQPAMIKQVANLLLKDQRAQAASLKYPIQSIDELLNPQVVKVVTDKQNYALYFSRSPIPFVKNIAGKNILTKQNAAHNSKVMLNYFKHIGIYAYRKDFLPIYAKLKPSALELAESLEQLRILENGYKIKMGKSKYFAKGIDVPEDLAEVVDILKDKTTLNRRI
jgi:3-deoxy-manno-octulosonate cytidylyltransferase (CMP-KDO synthetase)